MARTSKTQQVDFDAVKMKLAFHEALDDYSVYVWNGSDVPIKKPIGEALTDISRDIKTVKEKGDRHDELLTGIKARKDFIDSIINVFSKSNMFLKLTPIWRFTIKALALGISLFGAYKALKELNIL